jgi:hypothetical protein
MAQKPNIIPAAETIRIKAEPHCTCPDPDPFLMFVGAVGFAKSAEAPQAISETGI